jgi:hypothetical protein
VLHAQDSYDGVRPLLSSDATRGRLRGLGLRCAARRVEWRCYANWDDARHAGVEVGDRAARTGTTMRGTPCRARPPSDGPSLARTALRLPCLAITL